MRWSVDGFVSRCIRALDTAYELAANELPGAESRTLYAGSIAIVVRLVACLIAGEQIPSPRAPADALHSAVQAILAAVDDPGAGGRKAYEESMDAAFAASGYGVFSSREQFSLSDSSFADVAGIILRPGPDTVVSGVFFQSMPLSWLGSVYQGLLTRRPSTSGRVLEPSRFGRKDRGVYFTPGWLIDYIIESVIDPSSDSLPGLRVLDPAMGGGDFLHHAIEFLCRNAQGNPADKAEVAARCVYGVDIDSTAVEIARFNVWAASGYADGIADSIHSHLICANALETPDEMYRSFAWKEAFPEVFNGADEQGFDAVVGNPPYVASKNGWAPGGAGASSRGQSDSYLPCFFRRQWTAAW